MHSIATFIPSPSNGVWHIGPLPLRAYALGIIIGAMFAIWIGERRFTARGGRAGLISDVAIWAIPFGIVGATSPKRQHLLPERELASRFRQRREVHRYPLPCAAVARLAANAGPLRAGFPTSLDVQMPATGSAGPTPAATL